jgi:hypothetical protein
LKSPALVVHRRQSRPVLYRAFSDGHWYPSFSTRSLSRNLNASVPVNFILYKAFTDSAL